MKPSIIPLWSIQFKTKYNRIDGKNDETKNGARDIPIVDE